MKRTKPKGEGRTAQRVLSRLLDALSQKYPGIGISPDDFWFQKGDYVKSTWDLARWGAEIPHRLENGVNIKIALYSWDTMKQCAKGLSLLVPPRERLPHQFEVCADA